MRRIPTARDQPEYVSTAAATVSSSSSEADPYTTTVAPSASRESAVSSCSVVDRVQLSPSMSTVPSSTAPSRTSASGAARGSSLTTNPANSSDGVR